MTVCLFLLFLIKSVSFRAGKSRTRSRIPPVKSTRIVLSDVR